MTRGGSDWRGAYGGIEVLAEGVKVGGDNLSTPRDAVVQSAAQ